VLVGWFDYNVGMNTEDELDENELDMDDYPEITLADFRRGVWRLQGQVVVDHTERIRVLRELALQMGLEDLVEPTAEIVT
jgi:hypothetical protein